MFNFCVFSFSGVKIGQFPGVNLCNCWDSLCSVFSASQCQSRSPPKERLWNETSKFVIFGSSKKVIQKQTFATFFVQNPGTKNVAKACFWIAQRIWRHGRKCATKNALRRMHNKECECTAKNAQRRMRMHRKYFTIKNAQQKMHNKECATQNAHQRMRNKECEGTAKNEQ